jgi:WD40 repeat protein
MSELATKKRRIDGGASTAASNAATAFFDDSVAEESHGRLSRHIPNRADMDMNMASFNLAAASFEGGGAESEGTLDASAIDASSQCSSAYRKKIASAVAPAAGAGAGAASSAIGDKVLTFGRRLNPNALLGVLGSRSLKYERSGGHASGGGGGGGGGGARKVHTNPEKVLDAPDLPREPAQVVDWGPGDVMLIGLAASAYTWDAKTQTAALAVSLQDAMKIRCVKWMPEGAAAVAATTGGGLVVLDLGANRLLRSLETPGRRGVLAMSAVGTVMAVAAEGGAVYNYDLRCASALVATVVAHKAAATAIEFSRAEPHHLLSGGADGCVRIWDQRKTAAPKFAFSKVHAAAVGAVMWDRDHKALLFSGGLDGKLAHISCRSQNKTGVEQSAQTGSPITGIVGPAGAGEVLTAHGAGGCNLQLRATRELRLVGALSAPANDEPMGCVTLSPHGERVCATQMDETIKFWTAFDVSRAADRDRKRGARCALDDCLR